MAWIRCVKCGGALPAAPFTGQTKGNCSHCRRAIEARVLPAVFGWVSQPQPPVLPPSIMGAGAMSAPAVGAGETTCFYDPSRTATKSCAHCGVFISDAWAAQWGGQEVCLRCLDELRRKGQDSRFQSQRRLWDNIVLGLALGPWLAAVAFIFTGIFYFISVLMILLTLATAPTALFLGLRFWNAPRSLAPRGRGRLVVGLLLAGLQLAAWLVAIFALINYWGDLGW